MRIVVNYREGSPDTPVSTPEELDAVLDDMRQRSIDRGYPILAVVGPTSDLSCGMDVGAHGDKGFVGYRSRESRLTVESVGEPVDGTIEYRFQGRDPAPVPASAEVPYDEVRKAVHEFLATDGQQPNNITWRPFEPYSDD